MRSLGKFLADSSSEGDGKTGVTSGMKKKVKENSCKFYEDHLPSRLSNKFLSVAPRRRYV